MKLFQFVSCMRSTVLDFDVKKLTHIMACTVGFMLVYHSNVLHEYEFFIPHLVIHFPL